MDWLRSILLWWGKFADWWLRWAADAENYWWPLNQLTPLITAISNVIDGISGALFQLTLWFESFVAQAAEFLSWDEIQDRLQSFLDQVTEIWTWFLDRWGNVTDVVEGWWEGALSQVKDLIAVATEGLAIVYREWNNFWTITWPEFVGDLQQLSTSWDDFRTNTLPNLVSNSALVSWWQDRILDVQDLINSAFTLRDDLWAGWQEWRDSVAEFFSDPLKWLYDRLERFMDEYW